MRNGWVGPAVGHSPHAMVRYDEYPVSSPCQYGELADSAMITDSQPAIRSIAPMPSSSDSMSTWMCCPQVNC